MTYIPANTTGETVAVPAGLAVIPSTTSASGQTLVTGNRVNLGSATALEGSWTPSISGDIITLPSGYYYYLEAAQQGYHVSSVLTTGFLETQWYDESASSNIGCALECRPFRRSGNDIHGPKPAWQVVHIVPFLSVTGPHISNPSGPQILANHVSLPTSVSPKKSSGGPARGKIVRTLLGFGPEE